MLVRAIVLALSIEWNDLKAGLTAGGQTRRLTLAC